MLRQWWTRSGRIAHLRNADSFYFSFFFIFIISTWSRFLACTLFYIRKRALAWTTVTVLFLDIISAWPTVWKGNFWEKNTKYLCDLLFWRSNVGKRKHLQMRNLCTGTGIHLQNTQTTHWQWWFFSQSLYQPWIVWNISNWQPFQNRDSRNMMPVVAESAFQVKILKTFYWGKNFVACNLFID